MTFFDTFNHSFLLGMSISDHSKRDSRIQNTIAQIERAIRVQSPRKTIR
jgi:hypothetical protein